MPSSQATLVNPLVVLSKKTYYKSKLGKLYYLIDFAPNNEFALVEICLTNRAKWVSVGDFRKLGLTKVEPEL